jgi:predicted DNA binding protein
MVPIQNLIRDNGTALTMVMDCICDGIPLLDMAEEQGCFPIGMKMYSDGWEAVRLFAPNQSALRKYVSQLEPHGKVEILSTKVRSESGALRELGIAPVPFFGGLTEKQIEVLVSAFEGGLLCVPAKNRMDVVANQVGLSRSTYGEHLRKAIQTLVENSYPVLKLYAASYSSPSVKGDK